MHEDPQIDEFFRRGDEGDYAAAESLPSTAIALGEGDAENEPVDPALLVQRIERRARFKRWVLTGMSALALATAVAFGVRGARSHAFDSELGKGSDGLARAAHVQPARDVDAPVRKIESARPAPQLSATPLPAMPIPSPPPITQARRAAPATGKPSRTTTQRVAFAPLAEKRVGNSALPAVTITKPPTESAERAVRPPTARFAD